MPPGDLTDAIDEARPSPGFSVLLAGDEPEFRKVTKAFTAVDPVVFRLARSVPELHAALSAPGVWLVVIDLALPESAVSESVELAASRGVRHVVAVSRRDSSRLRSRAQRLKVTGSYFRRRPSGVIVQLIRQILQREVRSAPRAPLETPMHLAIGDRSVVGRTVNVSTTGLLALLPIDIGGADPALSIDFSLPQRGGRMSCRARIARVISDTGGVLTAFRFGELSAAARSQIARYVNKALGEDPETKVTSPDRTATRHAGQEIGELRAALTRVESGRRNHFRVRDLSTTGAFLFPWPPYDPDIAEGCLVSIKLRMPSGATLDVVGRIHRKPLATTLEGKLFRHGFAVRFEPPGTEPESIRRLLDI